METLRIAGDLAGLPPAVSDAVGTIGNYDGIHRGQRAILERVVDRARELSLPAAVVTFEPHPLAVLRPESAPRRLTTDAQKRDLLARLGVHSLVEVAFDQTLARTSPERFARELLFEGLSLAEIFVGSRFAFGRDRSGDLALLQALAAEAGRKVTGVAEVLDAGEPISSTRVRRTVEAGDVAAAERLLGRPYAVRGTVVAGAGKGRDLGFPTLNLATENEILPGNGVYVTGLRLDGEGTALASVANVGVRPTLHEEREPIVECHILDFEDDLYGREVEIDFLARLRGERTFGALDELVSQIGKDVETARGWFAEVQAAVPEGSG